MKIIVPVVLACLAVSFGCAAQEEAAPKSSKVQVICHLAYRANPAGKFQEKKIAIEIPLQSGPVPEIARTKTKIHKFNDMHVRISYDVNSLSVSVTDSKTGKQIYSQLYQLQPGLKNQFSGGHGFTGLAYINHPTSKTQLQMWCAVAK